MPITKLTKITTDTGVKDAHHENDFCDKAIKMEMRATFYVGRADEKSVTIDKVRLDWRTGRSGRLAGQFLANGAGAYSGGYTANPAFAKGAGSRTFDVGKTVEWWGPDHEIYWSQNFHFDSNNGRDIALCVGDDSNNFWFRLYRAHGNGGCSIASTVSPAAGTQRYAAAAIPTSPC